MELAGDEKRIQALFSELSLAEQSRVPRFEKLWRAGQPTSQPRRARKSLIAITATAIIVAGALFITWKLTVPSAVTPGQSQPNAPYAASAYSVSTAPPQTKPETHASVPHRRHAHPSRLIARQKQIDRRLQQQAALLANWQSPTETFMTSPAASVFKSLPQLNQSAKDLESFLPKNNESLKESNQ